MHVCIYGLDSVASGLPVVDCMDVASVGDFFYCCNCFCFFTREDLRTWGLFTFCFCFFTLRGGGLKTCLVAGLWGCCEFFCEVEWGWG